MRFIIPSEYFPEMRETLPVLVIAKALGFLAFGLFSGWWRYVSIRDILPVTSGCALGSVLYSGAVILLWGPYYVPRSIYFIDFGNTLLLVLAGRYVIRAGRDFRARPGRSDRSCAGRWRAFRLCAS